MATTSTTKPRTSRAKPAPEAEAESKPAKTETLQQLKNRLRNEAEREVLNAHKAEVIKITEAKYDEHGLEYVRRLSDEEKAQKEIEERLDRYPDLEAYIMQRIAKHGKAQVQAEVDELAGAEDYPEPDVEG